MENSIMQTTAPVSKEDERKIKQPSTSNMPCRGAATWHLLALHLWDLLHESYIPPLLCKEVRT